MDPKTKIINLVEQYIKLFPEEFENFKILMNDKSEADKDDYSQILSGDEYIRRKLWEAPETLINIFNVRFEPEDRTFFESKEGGRWFADTFPVFKASRK